MQYMAGDYSIAVASSLYCCEVSSLHVCAMEISTFVCRAILFSVHFGIIAI